MAINTQGLQSALTSLGDTGGAEAAASLGQKGDRAGLNSLVDSKVATLEKAVAALETFIDNFSKYDNYLDESWKNEDSPQDQSQPREDTRSDQERSDAATKAAETREANGQEQWRAPAGSPGAGQFIDMPHKALASVGLTEQGDTVKSLLESGDIAEAQAVAEQNLKTMNSALNSLYGMSFSVNVETLTASGGTMTKTKWEGPLGFEGQFTGDNRYILPMALDFTNVTFPQPFRWASEDIGAHDGARVIGTIEGINRLEDGTIWGWGKFDMKSELGKDAQRHVEEKLSNGVSLDLDRISAEVTDPASLRGVIGNLAEAVQDMNITTIKSARTRSATLVALPAFEGARIEACAEWNKDLQKQIDEHKEETLAAEEQEEMSETPIPRDEQLALERIREGFAKFADAFNKVFNSLTPAQQAALATAEEEKAAADAADAAEEKVEDEGFGAERRDAVLAEAGYDVVAVNGSGSWEQEESTGNWILLDAEEGQLLVVHTDGTIEQLQDIDGAPTQEPVEMAEDQTEELADTEAVAPSEEEDVVQTEYQPIPEDVLASLPEGTQVFQPGDDSPHFEGEKVTIPFVVVPGLPEEYATVAYLESGWFPVIESPGSGEESYPTIGDYCKAVAGADLKKNIEDPERLDDDDDDDDDDDEDDDYLDYAVRNEMDREERASLVASGGALAAPIAPPAAWFENPNFKMGTPLTVTKEGRVFGHLALWGTCHAAYANAAGDCISVPYSETNYSMFHLGVVETAEGTEVPVGRLAMETGHADDHFSSRRAIAHYENTGLAIADIRAGEDEFGIWFSGALRPDATPAQIRALKASPLSGDWRYHPQSSNLELVMALAVNMPGFAVPRPQFLVASGAVRTLVAAGILAPKKVAREKVEAAVAGDQLAIDDIKYLQKLAARERANEAKILKQRALVASGAPNKIHAMAAQLKGLAKPVEGTK